MAVRFFTGMLSSSEREENPPDMLLILINYLYKNNDSIVIGQLLWEKQFSALAHGLTLKCVRECVGFLSACGLCVSDYLYNASAEA